MNLILRQLFQPDHQPNNILYRLRVQFIQVMMGLIVFVAATGLIVQLLSAQPTAGMLATIAVIAASIGLLALLRRRLLFLASTLMVAMFVLASIFGPPHIFILLAAIALIAAAVLVTTFQFVVVNIVILGKQVFTILQFQPDMANGIPMDVVEAVVTLMALAVVSWTTRYFISRMRVSLNEAERTSSLLTATADIAQITTSLLDLNELFEQSVNMIRERFAFYHAQVFVLDETGRDAILVASTGEAGRKLLARKHKLAVGSTSVIGRVTSLGEPVVARDTDSDAVHRRNELLPDTRAELAVPIVIEGRIAGALDVQSTQANAFNENDIRALQTLADLLGTAIRNARLFEAQQRSVQEQQRLFLEAEANLREIQRLNQRLTRSGWDNYVHQPRTVPGVSLHDQEIKPEATWSENLVQASLERRTITHQANGKPTQVAVPILLRGEVIGAIEVEPGADIDLSEAVNMTRAIAQRLAISLDNARLFEETQAAIATEQQISGIVGQYQAVSSVDDLLSITLTELGRTLNAEHGAIRLGVLHPDGEQDT